MSMVSSFVFGVVLTVVPVPDGAGFTGDWERNIEQSDDPHEKMQEAMEQMRGQMDRGRGSGGRPRGGMGGGGGRPGGMGSGRREGGPPRPEIGGVADTLALELLDGELHVDDGERLQIYYLDGREHKREMANGTKLETVAELKGNAVLIEEKMERGRLDRKFELSPDGATMVLTTTVELGRMKDPVIIKTVYERVGKSS